MALLGIDLGGTKLAFGVFSNEGKLLYKKHIPLQGREGNRVGDLIISNLLEISHKEDAIHSIGISIPGIYRSLSGTVWAPNIPGWEDFPLLNKIQQAAGNKQVRIDSDRACCILGELWQGNAIGCTDAIFLTVGTGIGAGILINGQVFRGANDIAGAIGWMALQKPFEEKYISCGCFEYSASGGGIASLARKIVKESSGYRGFLAQMAEQDITAPLVFEALEGKDEVAMRVIDQVIESWGMAAANLVSLFNPQKILFGGGVFGPAAPLIPKIKQEAAKWAQPVSMKLVEFEPSALKSDAALYGAAYLASKTNSPSLSNNNV